MCGTEKTPSVKVAGDPHGTAKTTFFSYVGSESVKDDERRLRGSYSGIEKIIHGPRQQSR